MKVNRSDCSRSMLSPEPVERLSRHKTSPPLLRRNSQRWEPMKPAPPVTRTRIRCGSGREDRFPTDRVVFEPQAAHPLGLVDVPPVEDERAPHHLAQPLEVQELELVPLGHD